MADDEVYTTFQRTVASGGTLDEGVRTLRSFGVPERRIFEARNRYELDVGSIRDLVDPRSLVDDQQHLGYWYAGPRADDRCWPGLKSRLPLDEAALESVDTASTRIVSLLNPPGSVPLSGRGLVLGYVQSGKTTSFMSVIAKAADVGYRMFVVLSGITDNLRTQTQERLDEVLIGDQTSIWYQLTTIDDDFVVQPNAANILGDPSKRLLAVIKKNPYRLKNLLRWLNQAGDLARDSCPVLVIDDEADQASLNVGRARTSAINSRIDTLLTTTRSSYVAYSATPFANLLVEPSYAAGLYPRDFIVDLPRSPNYFGPEQIFGRAPLDTEGDDFASDGVDVVRHVPVDEVTALPTKKSPPGSAPLPASLVTAIGWFLLAAAARRARTGRIDNTTMLVHTSMLTAVQGQLAAAVSRQLKALRRRGDPALDDLRALWMTESPLVPPEGGRPPDSWDAVRAHLARVLEDADVVLDNSSSHDRLSYEGGSRTAIVVGGNTLSRGLTLEGLVCSFFVRTTKAYDSLLQMGRWFGYRPGYSDLVRIWMPEETESWFSDLATVEQEIRNEIHRYSEEAENVRPSEVAVRIRQHPKMQITSAAKMRSAVKVSVDYGATRQQTILFNHRDADWLAGNTAAADSLLAGLDLTEVSGSGRLVARDVPAQRILDFVSTYRFHERSRDLQSNQLSAYIDNQRKQGRLNRWSVVVMGNPEDKLGVIRLAGRDINLITRSRTETDTQHANIKSLVSNMDRVADLHDLVDVRSRAGIGTGQPVTDAALRGLRDREVPDVGLLALYPIQALSEPRETKKPGERRRLPLEAVADVIGACLFFPAAPVGARAVEYWAAPLPDVDADDDYERELEALDRADEQAGEARAAALSSLT